MTAYQLTGYDYLEANLLPLVLSIKPKKNHSYLVEGFLGLDRVSQQSIVISLGNHLETFWNKVVSDSKRVKNVIELNNMVNVGGKLRQVDHCFENMEEVYRVYLESKCNLNFDSEKSKASNKKLNEVKEALDADHAAYFVPCVAEIRKSDLVKYNNKGIQVYGVNWLLSKVDAPFTSEEYFTFAREVITPILVEMGL
jgi:hypothetical protein